MLSGSERVRMPEAGRIRRGVIGILQRDMSFLLIRRAARVARGGCWCFPGGHVERGETPRRAILRELAEELGIEVAASERIGAVRVGEQYVLAVWRVRHVGGTLRPDRSEIADVRWLTPAQIRTIAPGLPSNNRVLEMLGV